MVSVLIVLIVLIASMFLIQKKRKKDILVSYGGQEVHCCMPFNTAAVAFLTLPRCAFWVAEFAAMREWPRAVKLLYVNSDHAVTFTDVSASESSAQVVSYIRAEGNWHTSLGKQCIQS